MVEVKINLTREIGEQPDYMEFVDSDIADIFRGKQGHFIGDVLMAQIIKELRKLNGGSGRQMVQPRGAVR